MCTIRLSAVAVLVVVLRAQTPDDSFRFALTGDFDHRTQALGLR